MGRPAVLKVDIIADAKGVRSGVDQASSSFGKLGKVGKAAGLAAGAGLAAAGAAAAKFAYDSVKSASEVQQSFGALDSVYGKSAGQVKRWAAGAADSVGLAKSEYAGLSALVGSQLQGMGVATDKSAKKSNDLIKMGADLAATYGGSVKDAVSAVSSTLKGETDPIERYGVSIKQADIQARMASLGLDNLTGKAAKQAKATATLSLLTEQTRKAHGAFGRESNTLAGQQERLRAKYENVKAAVGKGLLPILTRFVGFLQARALPGAVRLGRQLAERLGPAFARVGGFIRRNVIPAAREFLRWFQDRIVPGIRRYVTPVLAGARAAFADVARSVRGNKPEINQLLGVVRRMAEFFANRVLPLVGRQVGAGFRVMGRAISIVVGIVAGLTRGIGWAIDKIRSLKEWLASIRVPKALSQVGDLAGSVFGAARYTGGGPQLAGYGVSYDQRRGLSTAGLTTSAGAGMGLLFGGAGYAMPAAAVIDARNLSTTVHVDTRDPLGLVDEARLARRLQQLLGDHAVRIGRASVRT